MRAIGRRHITRKQAESGDTAEMRLPSATPPVTNAKRPTAQITQLPERYRAPTGAQ